jgi:hypothetical protein
MSANRLPCRQIPRRVGLIAELSYCAKRSPDFAMRIIQAGRRRVCICEVKKKTAAAPDLGNSGG